MSSEVEFEMRGRAYRICRDYLHGSWKLIEAKDMVIKHISGGLSNHLFYCALPASTPVSLNEPSEVLVRFYGQVRTETSVHGEEALESLLAESVIFTLLSERRLGPRLYGVFPGGRVEQYIPARSMTTDEISIPEFSRQIAARMARMHALNVPITKEPTWMWRTMERWLKSSGEFLRSPSALTKTASPETLEKLRRIRYDDELDFLRRLVARVQSPVVFAHNDMQEGNILIKKTGEKLSDRISLIDFEYCSYNYRGFDLANHFCEWMYNYKLPIEPYFTADHKAFPNTEQQLNFIRAYLSTYEANIGRKPLSSLALENGAQIGSHLLSWKQTVAPTIPLSSYDSDDPPTPAHSSEDNLLVEVRVFTLASHLFWSLWSVVQGHVSKIPFGYLDYAVVRMDHYFLSKEALSREEIVKRKSDQISINSE